MSKLSEKSLQEQGLNATDVEKCIKKFVPCDYLSDIDELHDELVSNPMKSIGIKMGGYNISHAVQRTGGDVAVHDEYEFYFSSLEEPEAHKFANRLESLAMWMIEKSSYIKPDPNWKLLTLFRKLKRSEKMSKENEDGRGPQSELEFVGFVTIYKYFTDKDRKTAKGHSNNETESCAFGYRISQFVILPPFQRMGHGERLLRRVYQLAADSPQCCEVRIENPSVGFSKLRDATDARLLLETIPDLLGLPYPPYEQVKKLLKFTPAQTRHLWVSIIRKTVKSLPVRNIPDENYRFHNAKVANFEEEGFLCNVNGHKFYTGQFVRVAGRDQSVRLGHLVGINPFTKLIRLRWLYFVSDIPGKMQSELNRIFGEDCSKLRTQEVFYAFHEDFIKMEQLLGIVSIAVVDKAPTASELESRFQNGQQYYFRYVYDPAKFAMYRISDKRLKPNYRHVIKEIVKENSATCLTTKSSEREAMNGDEDVLHKSRPKLYMNALPLEHRNLSISEMADRSALFGGDFSSVAYSESLSGSTSEIVPYSNVNSLFAGKPKRYIITRRNPRSRSHSISFENDMFQLSGFCLDKVRRVVMKKKLAGFLSSCRSRFSKKGKRKLLLNSAAWSSQPIEDSLCLPSRVCNMLFERGKQMAYKLPSELGLERVASEWNHFLDNLCGCMLKHVSMVQSALADLCSHHDWSYRRARWSSSSERQAPGGMEALDSGHSMTDGTVIPHTEAMQSNLFRQLQERCTQLLRRMSSRLDATPFLEPVDPQRDGCPDYFDVIARPMDLGSVQKKLREGGYPASSAGLQDLYADVKLVFDNAMYYNPPSHPIHRQARRLFLSFLNAYRNILSNNLNILSKLTEEEVRLLVARERLLHSSPPAGMEAALCAYPQLSVSRAGCRPFPRAHRCLFVRDGEKFESRGTSPGPVEHRHEAAGDESEVSEGSLTPGAGGGLQVP
eukprot:753461-Hanusia_phi.AAC.6